MSKKKQNLSNETLDPANFKTTGWADIETLIEDKARHRPSSKSELFIVGCVVPRNKGGRWISLLKKWLERGCHVTHLMTVPEADICKIYKEIAAQYPSNFVPVEIRPDDVSDKEDKEILKNWQTFHFLIIENPRQLWLERNHPIGQVNAENCVYVPPSVFTNNDPRIDGLKEVFQELVEKYGVNLVSYEETKEREGGK